MDVEVAVAVILVDAIDHEGKFLFVISLLKGFLYFSRDRRQRSGSPVARDRRRGGGGGAGAGAGSRSRSPHSRSPAPRR